MSQILLDLKTRHASPHTPSELQLQLVATKQHKTVKNKKNTKKKKIPHFLGRAFLKSMSGKDVVMFGHAYFHSECSHQSQIETTIMF